MEEQKEKRKQLSEHQAGVGIGKGEKATKPTRLMGGGRNGRKVDWSASKGDIGAVGFLQLLRTNVGHACFQI